MTTDENSLLFSPLDRTKLLEQETDLSPTTSSYWRDAWRRLKKNPLAMMGLFTLMLLILFAIIGPLITPYTYYETHLHLKNLPPSL